MLIRLKQYLRNELNADAADLGGGSDPAPAPADTAPASTEPAAPAAGPARTPDGRFAPDLGQTMHEAMWGKDGLAAEEPPEDAQVGQQPDPKQPQAKPKDEDLTRPLEGKVSPDTQQRFQKLTHALKERDAQVQEITKQAQYHEKRANEFVSILNDAGIGPDEFGGFVDFRSALRSRNFDQAEAYLKAQLREFAIATGRNLAGDVSTVLDEFPDLAQRVQNMELTEQAALEVARARRVEAAVRQRHEQHQQHTQAAQQFQQSRTEALRSVAQQVAQWKRDDIDFAAKEAKIAAQMKRLRDVPPQQWLAKVQEYYELLNEGASLSKPPSGDIERPLRGGAGPAAASRQPASMYEAMFGAARPA